MARAMPIPRATSTGNAQMCVYLYCMTHLPTRGYGQGVMKVSRKLNEESVSNKLPRTHHPQGWQQPGARISRPTCRSRYVVERVNKRPDGRRSDNIIAKDHRDRSLGPCHRKHITSEGVGPGCRSLGGKAGGLRRPSHLADGVWQGRMAQRVCCREPLSSTKDAALL